MCLFRNNISHRGQIQYYVASFCLGLMICISACSQKSETVELEFQTTEVGLGDVQKIVRATGKIIPKNQVVIGSEVSGRITDIFVDYNSVVKKGDILAKIDTTDFLNNVQQIKSQIESANADIDVQNASIERAEVAMENATQQFNRQDGLYRKEAISIRQLELAKRDVGVAAANLKLARAQQRSNEARIKQLQSTLDTATTTLGRTTIRSPIDGIVIDRKVDPGQTVQSNFSTPELFTIAADLSEIDVHAQIVESDVGGLDLGDSVLFTVDAYPGFQVTGEVEQLRVNGKESNNIVTYVAVISAKNPGGKLMPGMTASLRISTEVRPNVLRIPIDAQRFRPSPEQIVTLEAREEVSLESYKIRDLLDPYYRRLENIGMSSDRIDQFKAVAKAQTEALRKKIKDPAFSPEHASAKQSLSNVVEATLETFLTGQEYAGYEGEVALERTQRTTDLWVPEGGDKISRRTVRLGLIDDSYAEVVDGLNSGEKVITRITEKIKRK